jgi:hypothetical protein
MARLTEPKGTSSDKLKGWMKKVAILLLILLLLLVALPLGMSMAMGTCPNSHPATCAAGVSMCLAIIGLLAFGLALLLGTVPRGSSPSLSLLLVGSVEHPPRLA